MVTCIRILSVLLCAPTLAFSQARSAQTPAVSSSGPLVVAEPTDPSVFAQFVARLPYRFSPSTLGGWTAENADHGLQLSVVRARVEVTQLQLDPLAIPAWSLALRCTFFGRDGAPMLLGSPRGKPHANRIEFEHSPELTEWFVNDMNGIEQGWTVAAPPVGAQAGSTSPIQIDLLVEGSLPFQLDPDELGGCFLDSAGEILLRYEGLVAWDAMGTRLPAQMSQTAQGVRLLVQDQGAVYPITIDPLLLGPVWTRDAVGQFAASLASGGDVNGDGINDLLVGAPTFSGAALEEGCAHLFLGVPSGLAREPMWTYRGAENGAHLGAAVALAGDVNGDGFEDVLVGAPESSIAGNSSGRAHLFLGSPEGPRDVPDWTLLGSNLCAFLGESIAGAGDVNGDGYDDVVVGSRGASHSGAAYLFLGSPSGLSATPSWSVLGNGKGHLGRSVACAGDVNGDGFDDLVIGEPRSDRSGMQDSGGVQIHLGSQVGPSVVPDWFLLGDQVNAELGRAVAGVGDVNGDGFDDVLVGEPFWDNPQNDEGRVHLYLGSASGPALTPAWTVESDRRDARFGEVLVGAGDLDNDGFDDVFIGSPGSKRGSGVFGRALAYRGDASGLGALPAWVRSGSMVRGGYGEAVGAAGDLNGDGFDDVLVGAPFWQDNPWNEGRAFVYLGGQR